VASCGKLAPAAEPAGRLTGGAIRTRMNNDPEFMN
jgi:hypothetical protein